MVYSDQDLYNSINYSGNIIWAPIKDGLQHFTYIEEATQPEVFQAWMTIHEFGHSLAEGVHSLFVKNGIPTETDELCHVYSKSLGLISPKIVTDEMRQLLNGAKIATEA